MEKLQKCVNFILTVPVFFATSCKSLIHPFIENSKVDNASSSEKMYK
jgi:hypothetical protein